MKYQGPATAMQGGNVKIYTNVKTILSIVKGEQNLGNIWQAGSLGVAHYDVILLN
jgi:hypothetical protein